MKQVYLTIDDSPSSSTKSLVSYLQDKKIPTLLFARGDLLSENYAPVVRAIESGMVIGNHTYSHKRASELTFEQECEEILKTEKRIDAAYQHANTVRPGKYFRYSYLDRGTGSWVVDFNAAPAHQATLKRIFWEGLNFSDQSPPSAKLIEKKQKLQEFLKAEGFTVPFKGVTHEWYTETEIAAAADCFFTYSTSDWMLTRRHLDKNWPYKTIEDLKRKIDDDPFLTKEGSTNIILAHDQPEIYEVVTALIDHFIERNFKFLDFGA